MIGCDLDRKRIIEKLSNVAKKLNEMEENELWQEIVDIIDMI